MKKKHVQELTMWILIVILVQEKCKVFKEISKSVFLENICRKKYVNV